MDAGCDPSIVKNRPSGQCPDVRGGATKRGDIESGIANFRAAMECDVPVLENGHAGNGATFPNRVHVEMLQACARSVHKSCERSHRASEVAEHVAPMDIDRHVSADRLVPSGLGASNTGRRLR